jgi:NAD(P)-dependent dehydrogenase (short-subunit alcohol dehydrogenase family)
MKWILRALLVVSAVLPWQAALSDEVPSLSKVVLITGASRGIGIATAELLAEKGYLVYAGIRTTPVSQLPTHPNLRYEVLDVTDLSTIQQVVSRIIKREGHLDVLINNAGYALGGPVECLTMKEIQEQMDVNFFGAILVMQEVLPHMRAQKSGHIINISSEQGVYGQPYGSLYTASKAALESLSEALSQEVSAWNVSVSIVEPGQVATNFFVKLGSKQVALNPYKRINELIAKSLEDKRVPSETCQTPEQIAHVLQAVIEDPHPKLRYQTSALAEKTVAQYITDTSGAEYSKRMKTEVDLWLSNQ